METRQDTRIESLIKAEIRQFGPMDIGRFMTLSLMHYYGTRDPLGSGGDFTTAPEISQLFGEMIGLALADTWMRAGSPEAHLAELGPGRGTLMSDILRATKNVPGFHAALSIHMVETSQTLTRRQKDLLKDYPHVVWHEDTASLPDDRPMMIVANEFFDALPIRQAIMTKAGWQERVVGLDENGALIFGTASIPAALMPQSPAGVNTIIEFSPARDQVFTALCQRVQTQGGCMLLIDYGHDVENATGDTLQAVYKHTHTPVLNLVGEADLTSHVDFRRLKDLAREAGCQVHGTRTQADFLQTLGIMTRLEQLERKNPGCDLRAGVARLVDAQQMGQLFRVLGVSGNQFSSLPGL